MKTCRLLPLLTIIITVAWIGCAVHPPVGETRLVESYGPDSYWNLSGPGVFVGVSKEFSDESAARNDAALDARRQIVRSLEMEIEIAQVETLLVRGRTDEILGGEIFSQTKTNAVASNVLHVREEGYYVEKWRKQTGHGVKYMYKVWCLIRYSRADHERMLSDVVDKLLAASEPTMAEARAARQAGRIREAVFRLHRIRELTEELDQYHGVPLELSQRIRELVDDSNDLLTGITMLVAVDEEVKGENVEDCQFEPRLAEALTLNEQFGVKTSFNWSGVDADSLMTDQEYQHSVALENGADLLLIGQAQVDYIEELHEGVYVARANIRLKLVEPATGVVLWETDLPGKIVDDTRGFANTPQRAAKNALALANYSQQEVDPFILLAGNIAGELK